MGLKVKIEIDPSDLTMFTTAKEDREIARLFMDNLTDDDVVEMVKDKGLFREVLDEIAEGELEKILSDYGYCKKDD